jgi:hypothetical protein
MKIGNLDNLTTVNFRKWCEHLLWHDEDWQAWYVPIKSLIQESTHRMEARHDVAKWTEKSLSLFQKATRRTWLIALWRGINSLQRLRKSAIKRGSWCFLLAKTILLHNIRASLVASLKKHPAQMIWDTFGTTPDKKRLKICTKKRSFPAASLKQHLDACILF